MSSQPPEGASKVLSGAGRAFGAGFVAEIIRTTFGWIARWFSGWISLGLVSAFQGSLRRSETLSARMMSKAREVFAATEGDWVDFVGEYLQQMGVSNLDWAELRRRGASVTGPDTVERIGKAFLEPLLNTIVDLNDVDVLHGGLTPEAGIRGAQRYLGINLQFQMNAWYLHLIGDTMSFGMFKSLKDLPNAISWSYGLGWLSWLVMGVPFQIQITDPMRRYYNERLRPTQYTRKQVMDLYSMGRVSGPYTLKALAQLGYSNDKISNIFALEREKPSLAQVRALVERGEYTWEQCSLYFINQGFDAAMASSLASRVYYGRAYAETERLLNIVDKAYLEDKKTRLEVQGAYRDAEYRVDEIAIILDRLDLQKDLKPEAEPYVRRLTPANIGRLYQLGHYTRTQAERELERVGFEPVYVDDFLALYPTRIEKPPEPVEIPIATLGRMFKSGVISEGEYRAELVERGIEQVDITRYIRLYTPVEPKPEPVRPPRELSMTMVGRIYQLGFRPRSWAEEHLTRLEIRPEDITVLLDAVYAPLPEEEAEPRRLPVSVLGGLWRREIITSGDFREYLIQLGYTPADSDYYILFFTEEPKPAPEPPPPTELSLSTVGRLHAGQYITTAEGAARLERIGIRLEDAQLLLTTLYIPPEPEVPGSRQLSTAQIGAFYQRGIISENEARTMWRDQRWVEEDVQRLVTYYAPLPEVVPPPPEPRLLSPSWVGSLYREGALTLEQALQRLVEAGYTETDAALILEYIYPVLEPEVVEPRRFSTEQVGRLYQQGIIPVSVAYSMMTDLLWDDESIDYILALYTPPPEVVPAPIPPQELSPPTTGRLFRETRITLTQAIERLEQVPYTLQDSMLLLALYNPYPIVFEIIEVYRAEELTRVEAIAILETYGFTTREIDLMIQYW
jgi:hypothetical protein